MWNMLKLTKCNTKTKPGVQCFNNGQAQPLRSYKSWSKIIQFFDFTQTFLNNNPKTT